MLRESLCCIQIALVTYRLLNPFDAFLIRRMNSLVGRSELFDKVIAYLSDNALVTALLIAVFWAYWFRLGDPAKMQKTREHLLVTMWAAIAGIVIARALALNLPFRVRPRYDPSIHFLVADPRNPGLMDWSAFPSDHAVMYSALAVGLCFVSLRLGLIAALYVVCAICFPRAYLGYHYPTDLLVGMIIGSMCAYGFNLQASRRWLAAPLLPCERSSPRAFYMALFFLTFQFATMFDSLRASASLGYHFAEHFLMRKHL
jgi:membrane-associated phospholipid phosphatase